MFRILFVRKFCSVFLRENFGKFDTLTLYFAGVKSDVESAQLRHCSEALESVMFWNDVD